jgi:hypothetical protein
MEVATEFGYTLGDVDPNRLVERYQRYPNRFSRGVAKIRARLALRRRWRRILRMLGLKRT